MSLDLESSSSQWVNLGTPASLQNVSGGSVMGWVLWESIVATVGIMCYSIGAGAPTATSRAAVERGTGAANAAARRLDADAAQTLAGGTIAAGQRTHVAITMDYSGQAFALYLDGVSVATSSPAGWTANASNTASASASIGAQDDGSANFVDGRIQDCRCYSRALSAAEIQTIFSCEGRDGIVNGLQSRFKLTELAPGSTASGAGTVRDSGLQQNNGTPTASPVYAEWIVANRRRRKAS